MNPRFNESMSVPQAVEQELIDQGLVLDALPAGLSDEEISVSAEYEVQSREENLDSKGKEIIRLEKIEKQYAEQVERIESFAKNLKNIPSVVEKNILKRQYARKGYSLDKFDDFHESKSISKIDSSEEIISEIMKCFSQENFEDFFEGKKFPINCHGSVCIGISMLTNLDLVIQ
jgi:hypothetical protein